MIALLVAAVVVGLDQVSKQWALAALRHVGSTLALPGPVDLTLVFNRSNAFGLVPVSGELTRWVLAVLGLVVAAILVRVVVRGSTSCTNTPNLVNCNASPDTIGNYVKGLGYAGINPANMTVTTTYLTATTSTANTTHAPVLP